MKKLYNFSLRLFAVATLATVSGLAACSDEDENNGPVEPPFELENQIMVDGDKEHLIDIKSALWEKDSEGFYTFYLSPRAGIVHVEKMEEMEDYLKVKVKNPAGTVDLTQEAQFSIEFGTVKVSPTTMKSDVEKAELQVDLVKGTTTLNLYVLAEMKSGKKLLVRYNGTATEAQPIALNNQWQAGREITAIGSCVEWRHRDRNVYYLYNEKDQTAKPSEGSTAKFIEISLSTELKGDIDLATADKEQVQITYGELSSVAAASLSGMLRVSKDKSGSQLTVSLESLIDGQRLRASYTGSYKAGYESENRFKITPVEGDVVETALTKVFRQEPHNVTNQIAFGDKEAPAEIAALTEGRYAVQINIAKPGETIDLATTTAAKLQLYDYTNYKTYDTSKGGAQGQLVTVADPNGGDAVIYLRFNVEFDDGTKSEGEWYGAVSGVPEASYPDLTPIKPVRNSFQVFASEGVIDGDYDLDITGVLYNEETGKYNNGGNQSDYHVFSFISEKTYDPANPQNYDTPILYINKDMVGKGEIKLDSPLNSYMLDYGKLGYMAFDNNESFQARTTGAMNVSQDSDGTWHIYFTVTNLYQDWGGSTTGDGKIFVVNYVGKVQPK